MHKRNRRAARSTALAALAVCVLCASIAAPAAPKVIPVTGSEEYWRELSGAQLSPDGRWLSYRIDGPGAASTLFFKAVDRPQIHSISDAHSPVFSSDGRWATAVTPGGIELLDLAAGRRERFVAAAGAAFSADAHWLIVQTNGGSKLKLRNLRTGAVRTVSNVNEYAIDAASRFLIYLVDEPQQSGNGVYLLHLKTAKVRTLAAGPHRFAGLTWSDAGARLAVLQGSAAPGLQQRNNVLRVWRSLGTAREDSIEWTASTDNGFPADHVLSELAPLHWSSDGGRLVVGIKQQKPVQPDKPDAATNEAHVIVWHWKDREIQEARAMNAPGREQSGTLSGVVHLDSRRFVQIDTDGLVLQAIFRLPQSAVFTAEARWALTNDERPYLSPRLPDDLSLHDIYRTDTTTGRRELIARRVTNSQFSSADRQWVVYLTDDKVLRAYHLQTGRHTLLDEPAGLRAPRNGEFAFLAGGPRWSADGRSVLFHSQRDIWMLPLDGGKAVNLTRGEGEAQSIAFRLPGEDGTRPGAETLARLDTDIGFNSIQTAGDPVDTGKPLVLSAIGEYSKQTGYWRLEPGKKPHPLIWEQALLGHYQSARAVDRVVFARQTFEQYPDYWVSTRNFKAPRRMTDLYPTLQSDYAWGSNRLVDFNLPDGRRRQGVLTLPANYEPGRRYPMVVSQYELQSDYLHKFFVPYSHDSHMTVNPSLYASNGYLVLRPDIPPDSGRPGTDALECVTAAVNKVLGLGYADPKRLGLIGFSFGGYRTTFIVTQTSLFAAAVSGGGWTDLVSADLGSPGRIETAQFAMGPLWDAPDIWQSQSPSYGISRLTTPLLLYKGDRDVSVGDQPLMFYKAAYRLGKPVVMLEYPQGGHGIGNPQDRLDFRIRVQQFFDHHLKGAPAPRWLSDGVPWMQRGSKPESAASSNLKYTLEIDASGIAQEGRTVLWRWSDGSNEGAQILGEVPLRQGRARIEGTVDWISTAYVQVFPADDTKNMGEANLVLEPGELSVVFKPRPYPAPLPYADEIRGGRYFSDVFGVWQQDPLYTAALDRAWTVWSKYPQLHTAAERNALEQETMPYFKQAEMIKTRILTDVYRTHPDPLVRFLATQEDTEQRRYLSAEAGAARIAELRGLARELPRNTGVQWAIDLLSRRLEAQAIEQAIKPGVKIQDFSAPDLKGQTVRLSDVYGKNQYVLIEFWASWCKPCRAAIPSLKKTYEKFHDKGFEIVSFSLDKKSDDWKRASGEEQLPWINLSDLQAFNSPVVRAFGVQGVPVNYLVDRNGTVVAVNAWRELEEKLAGLNMKDGANDAR